MRLRILVLLVILAAIFPSVVVDACQAIVHGFLDVAATIVGQADHGSGGGAGRG